MTRSERPLMCSGCWGALRGTGPRATGAGGCVFFGALRGTGPRPTGTETRFFVVRGPSRLYQREAGFPASPTSPPRSLPHPGHPASDVIAIKVLTDLFSVLRLRAIDIQVFQTFRIWE